MADPVSEPSSVAHNAKTPQGGKEAPENRNNGSEDNSFLQLKNITQISAVITLIGTSIYMLGILTIFLPIYRTYGTGFTTAWYIVSAVPRTAVAGHGVKSLLWPASIITVTSMLLVLMTLSGFNIARAGWRHARATQTGLVKTAVFMITVYVLVFFILIACLVFIDSVASNQTVFAGLIQRVPNSTIGLLGSWIVHGVYLICVLYVVIYLVLVLALILRGQRYIRRVIGAKVASRETLAKVFSATFAVKTIALIGLTSVAISSVYLLIPVPNTTAPDSGATEEFLISANDLFLQATTYALAFFLLSLLLLALYLIIRITWRVLRYTVRLIRTRTLPSMPENYVSSLRTSLSPKAGIFNTLLYATILFLAFYFTWLGIVYYFSHLAYPLINSVRLEVRSGTRLDDLFIPLVILGTAITAIFMYRNVDYSMDDFFRHSNWKPFLKGLRKSLIPPLIPQGLLRTLAIAYSFAFLTAFLLIWLKPPPLPRVAFAEQSGQSASTISLAKLQEAWRTTKQSGQSQDVTITTGCLLAHSEGHWYLFDESERNLLIIRDQDKNLIMLPLDKPSLETPCPPELQP